MNVFHHLSRERTASVNLRYSAPIMLLTALLGHAQPAANTNRSTTISDARMRTLLQGMGIDFTESSSDDSTVFAFQLNDHTVALLNHVTSMQLSACFEGPVDMLRANQWNQVHYSTRVYVDQHGCGSLGATVGFAGGLTNEMLEAFISQFCTDVTIYAKYVSDPPSDPIAPPVPSGAGVQQVVRSSSPIGTMAWTQVGQYTKLRAPWPDAAKSAPGLLKIYRNISLKYDPGQWKLTASHNEGEFDLSHSSGDAHALVIAEPGVVPLDVISDIALANAQSADPNAKVVFRDKRRVNGAVVYFLKIEANVDTVPMVYWGYFYAGESGTVQVVASTTKNLLPQYQKDFLDLLNGFMVSK